MVHFSAFTSEEPIVQKKQPSATVSPTKQFSNKHSDNYPNPNESQSRSHSLSSQEGELVLNLIIQKLEGSSIKSDYLSQKSTGLHKYLTRNTFNEIIIGNSGPSDDQVENNACK